MPFSIIMGLEEEFSVHSSENDKTAIINEILVEIGKKYSGFFDRNKTGFYFPNGTRIYFELKDIIEGGTCEVQLDPLSLITSEKAISRILSEGARRLSLILGSDIQIAKLSNDYSSCHLTQDILKKNKQSFFYDLAYFVELQKGEKENHSNGSHYNFGVSSFPQKEKMNLLLACICTSAVEGGGGGIGFTEGGRGFTRDTRAGFIHKVTSGNANAAASKPIIKLTDESLSKGTHRFQITGMGFNQSEMSLLMRTFPLSLLFLGFEVGHAFDRIELVNPLLVLRISANDIYNQQTFQVWVNGEKKRLTVLDLRYLLFKNIRSFIRSNAKYIPGWVSKYQVMKKWKYILDKLRSNRIEELGDMLDWAIKYRFYNHFLAVKGASWQDIKIIFEFLSRQQNFNYLILNTKKWMEEKESGLRKILEIFNQLLLMDISYQSISENSMYNIWQKMGWLSRAKVVDDKDIEKAMFSPPAGAIPRAELRAKEIKKPTYAYEYVDWDKILLKGGRKFVDLSNPFCDTDKLMIKDLKRGVVDEGQIPISVSHRSF